MSKILKTDDNIKYLLQNFNEYLNFNNTINIYKTVNYRLAKNSPRDYFHILFREFKKSIDYQRKPALDRLLSNYLKNIFKSEDVCSEQIISSSIDDELNSINNILQFYYLYKPIDNQVVIKYLDVELCNIHDILYINIGKSLEIIEKLYDRGIKFNKINKFKFLFGILLCNKLDKVKYLVDNTNLGYILNTLLDKIKKLNLELISNLYSDFIKLIVDKYIEVTDEIIEKLEYIRLEILGGFDEIPNNILNYVIQESTVFNNMFIDYLVYDIGLSYDGCYYNTTYYCRIFIYNKFIIENDKHILLYFIGCHKNLRYIKNVLEYFPNLKITPADISEINSLLKKPEYDNDIKIFILDYITNL